MLIRTLSHLMRYCEPVIRRAVPLALALIPSLTLNHFHSDRQLMSPVAVVGLMSVLVALLDVKTTILGNTFLPVCGDYTDIPLFTGKSYYPLYGLASAMQPRMLATFDEELRALPVSVRVGQAGKPQTTPPQCCLLMERGRSWSQKSTSSS